MTTRTRVSLNQPENGQLDCAHCGRNTVYVAELTSATTAVGTTLVCTSCTGAHRRETDG